MFVVVPIPLVVACGTLLLERARCGEPTEECQLARTGVPLDQTQRISLIAEAVRYCQHVAALGMPVSCYSKALREPVFFLWECRNGPKAQAAQYRSRAAVGLKHGSGQLVYDHAVPFVLLQAELMALRPATEDAVRQTLLKFGTTVLITKGEHDRLTTCGYGRCMPSDWDGTDPLARYRAAGIELVDNHISFGSRAPSG